MVVSPEGPAVRFEVDKRKDGSAEFNFPKMGGGEALCLCCYLHGPSSNSPYVYATGRIIRRINIPLGKRVIFGVPAEGIRHAAATGDPYPLIDWLLENACEARPWLAEALRAAIDPAGAA
jgi:hypothetical protein